MKVISYKNEMAKVNGVKSLIKSAGNQIFSVWFTKRSTGERRKIAARLHVQKPQYSKAPKSKGKVSYRRAQQDDNKGLMTIFDCNVLKYDKKNRLNGRGGYKSIPLSNVYRLKVQGEIYRIL